MVLYQLKYILTSILLLVCSSFVLGQSHLKLSFDADVGLRFENMDWSIAGNLEGTNPNVKSELKWKDLVIAEFKISSGFKLNRRLSFEAGASFGKTLSGKVSDIDYEEDNRNKPSYQLFIENKKGSNISFFTQLGYHFYPLKSLEIYPVLGFKYSSHLYWLSDKSIMVGEESLNSSYHSYWKGPFTGIFLNISLIDKLKIQSNFLYHQLNYKAEANWNLINQFSHPISFLHTAKGYQISSSFSPSWQLNNKVNLYMNISHNYSTTAAGNDLAFMNDGSQNYTKLNEVSLGSWFSGLGIKYYLDMRH